MVIGDEPEGVGIFNVIEELAYVSEFSDDLWTLGGYGPFMRCTGPSNDVIGLDIKFKGS